MGIGPQPFEGWPSNDSSPWMAMVTLLDLRGAEPWQLGKYRAIDRKLYAAIYQVTQTENITPAIAAEQLEKVRRALNRYADPNYDGALEERVPPLVTPWMPNPPPVLQQAVMASDGPILKLLLDRGASTFVVDRWANQPMADAVREARAPLPPLSPPPPPLLRPCRFSPRA